ncbi:uncharacterized protein [Salmo salar]|uniref:Uncharacterized protein LOC106605155 isoform X2 n=1 Tax=Salmo salar TaxID=8030 RepID=A0A1S3RUM7_SALSA|nr:uncharacterized protein LOC106605155 [Salmo salar]XP_014055992.1 uncharacterized protein LOC106605155 [Salmo salar]|eukprot:XP_014055991.1 PREDICTED: uncharacterized protein LOC106605155 isoform X2 [Salmo salar]
METQHILVWRICLILALLPHPHQCLSVHFQNKGLLYVAPGRELVLQTQFQITPTEKIIMVIWDRQTEKGQGQVRLANHQDAPGNPLDQKEASFRVENISSSDYGMYTITVTDQMGNEQSANILVREIVAAPVASLSLQCEVANDRAQWDSPVFSWLVDGVELSNQTDNLSADGRRLYVSGMKGHNYTCVVNSSLGTSVTYYVTDSPTPSQSIQSCNTLCGVLLGFIIAILITCGYLYWKCRQRRT